MINIVILKLISDMVVLFFLSFSKASLPSRIKTNTKQKLFRTEILKKKEIKVPNFEKKQKVPNFEKKQEVPKF